MTREQWRRYVELFGDRGLLAELERLWAIEDVARRADAACAPSASGCSSELQTPAPLNTPENIYPRGSLRASPNTSPQVGSGDDAEGTAYPVFSRRSRSTRIGRS
jgi:hypothetical protein